jgi:hypothetical protein
LENLPKLEADPGEQRDITENIELYDLYEGCIIVDVLDNAYIRNSLKDDYWLSLDDFITIFSTDSMRMPCRLIFTPLHLRNKGSITTKE